MASFAERMMGLFKGMEEAHGIYQLSDEIDSNGKRKGKAFTVREETTLQKWEEHLAGKTNIGVIPIRSNNTCFWGAIDIDDYNLDIQALSKRVSSKKLPLFPLRSKSGGCHLVLFLKEAVPARDIQRKLNEIAAALGYGRSEIFPKQAQVLVEKGDLGNWLNMPYYGGDNGTRYCLDENGEAMSIATFLLKAQATRLTAEELDEIEVSTTTDLEDGPPCLQALIEQGFPQGTRNNGLFALGVYCRKAFPDTWEDKLEEFNSKYMDPALESKEVQTIQKQIGKKDYNYRCNDQPICNFCNAPLCRTRQFGVGGGALPVMRGLSKLPTDQPVWFLDVNGIRLELNTEQLQQQTKFQKACMDAINYMPPKVNDRQWQNIIQGLLDKCEVLEKPKEASISDQFIELVYFYCTDSRLQAQAQEELLLGRPWVGPDPEDPSQQRVFFRIRDFEEFLLRHGFKHYNRSQMISKLQGDELKAKHHFFKIKGKGVNVWYLAEPEQQEEPFELPKMEGDVL